MVPLPFLIARLLGDETKQAYQGPIRAWKNTHTDRFPVNRPVKRASEIAGILTDVPEA
ncbi:MAG: hypothetical protein ABJH85_00610 [Paracoccaceae bacterium]